MPKGFVTIGDVIAAKHAKKPPAYEWQDLALGIIKELNIPGFKRSAVFKACKQYSKAVILSALNDTKELCQTGERWKYFFKKKLTVNILQSRIGVRMYIIS